MKALKKVKKKLKNILENVLNYIVSMVWKFHKETRDKLPERDFLKLNKMALTQGFYKANVNKNKRIFFFKICIKKGPFLIQKISGCKKKSPERPQCTAFIHS